MFILFLILKFKHKPVRIAQIFFSLLPTGWRLTGEDWWSHPKWSGAGKPDDLPQLGVWLHCLQLDNETGVSCCGYSAAWRKSRFVYTMRMGNYCGGQQAGAPGIPVGSHCDEIRALLRRDGQRSLLCALWMQWELPSPWTRHGLSPDTRKTGTLTSDPTASRTMRNKCCWNNSVYSSLS